MRDVEDTDRTFFSGTGFNLDGYLATAVDGQQSTGPVERVVLRFKKEAAHLGREFVWNPTQRIMRHQNGLPVVEFNTGALYAVQWQVLACGGAVKVFSPPALRRAVATAAEDCRRQHQE